MRRSRTFVLRTAALVFVTAGSLAAFAPPGHAAEQPEPLSSVTNALPTLPLPTATLPLPSLPLPTGTTSGGSATASSTTSTSTTTGSTAPRRAQTGAESSTAAAATSGSPVSVAADTPVATLCLIATGGTAPAFEVDAAALGIDLSSPLVEQFPQAFAPCPAGAVPAGDHVAAVDATVEGLVGACVRVTREVLPLQTTLVVLDHDLVRELTAAGLPLQQLVVPCPSGSGSGAATSPSDVAGPGSPGARQGDSVARSAVPGRLAFTGSQVVPTVLVGLVLVALGVVLVRAAGPVAVRRRRH
jgi:hypothetical protein